MHAAEYVMSEGSSTVKEGIGSALPNVSSAMSQEEEEVEDTHVFALYRCLSITFGKPHPGNIVEGASLSAAHLPSAVYPLLESLPPALISEGKLSNLQLEAILYACQKHQTLYSYRLNSAGDTLTPPRTQSDGSFSRKLCTRAGFFIGDQTGVGKGRQSAGIIIANWARGRTKHIWFSTSTDLRADAERDMRDLGSYINIIDGCKELEKNRTVVGLSSEFKNGVLFCTYSMLARPARLEQIIKWCGGEDFDGCLIFDESHKAKNLSMDGSKTLGSLTATAALKIQRRMPLARVTYLSATGVTEPVHLGFMERLGLWGPHTSFPSFKEFHTEISKHSIAVLELIAMEMKMSGTYVSRGLSYSDCEFEIIVADTSTTNGALYDKCCILWAQLRVALKKAIARTNSPSRIMRSYWATHQRFFLQLCVSLKVERIVELAETALEQGDCVVIGLQKTGESSAEAVLGDGVEGTVYPSPVSVEKEIFMRFIATTFPTKMCPKDVPGDPSDPVVKAMKDIETIRAQEEFPLLVKIKHEFLRRVAMLVLPPNPLDDLIDKLGGVSKVAEMTGRRGRMVRVGPKSFLYQSRGEDEDDTTRICINEKTRFMNGEKLVAIISEAASTGISLHSSLNVRNQRRRHHITIELPWSADRAIQQLGRTHRSHQKSGPTYKLVVCSLAGELRCVMAVCSRLKSLGALTRGDRRASVGFDFDEYDIDTKYGRKALKDMSMSIKMHVPYPGVDPTKMAQLDNLAQELAAGTTEQATGQPVLFLVLNVCITLMGFDDGDDAKVENIRSFWNRLLGLQVKQQQLLYGYLSAVLASVIREAKREGTYVDNIVDLKGQDVVIRNKFIMHTDSATNLATVHYEVLVNRGLSFTLAAERLKAAESEFQKSDEYEEGNKIVKTGANTNIALSEQNTSEVEVFVSGDEDTDSNTDLSGAKVKDTITKSIKKKRAKDHSGFYISRQEMFGRRMLLLAITKTDSWQSMNIYRPNTGKGIDMNTREMLHLYRKVEPPMMEKYWTRLYNDTENRCVHKRGCLCVTGRRMVTHNVVNGNIVQLWPVIQRITETVQQNGYTQRRKMQIVRCETSAGERLVGLSLNNKCISTLTEYLKNRNHVLEHTNLRSNVMYEPVGALKVKTLARSMKKPQDMLSFFEPNAPREAENVHMSAEKSIKMGSTSTISNLNENAGGRNIALQKKSASFAKPVSRKRKSSASLTSMFDKMRNPIVVASQILDEGTNLPQVPNQHTHATIKQESDVVCLD
eukprot:CFRG8498T1